MELATQMHVGQLLNVTQDALAHIIHSEAPALQIDKFICVKQGINYYLWCLVNFLLQIGRMKEIILFTVFFAFCESKAFCQKAQVATSFSLSGRITGVDAGIICLYYRDLKGSKIKDTVQITNGNFKFSGSINEPTSAAIAGEIGPLRLDNDNLVQIYLEPGDMHVILKKNKFKELKMTGSYTEKESQKLDSAKATLYTQYKELNQRLSKFQGEAGEHGNERLTRDSMTSIKEKVKNIDSSFMAENPKSYVTLDLLFDYFSSKEISFDSAKSIYSKLDTSITRSVAAKKIYAALNSRENNVKGKDAYEFIKDDIYDHTIRLSSFKNKNYVLLEFWASWCVPCFTVNPQIMDIYNRYGSKGLVIMGISMDNKATNWKAAINRYNGNKWLNFLDSNGPDADLHSKFNILALPELVLIDKNGKIIGHYLGLEKNSNLSDLNKTLEREFQK